MDQPGLYFPYVHVRDDAWLKAAALYWPSVRRLVPRGYLKHDSPTAETFFRARVLRDQDPQSVITNLGWDLVQALDTNADSLMSKYSLQQAYGEPLGERWIGSGPEFEDRSLGWIHLTKFPPQVVDRLSNLGLARLGRSVGAMWPESAPANKWLGLHPVLAGAYMSALATRISEHSSFQPLTDQVDLRVATPSREVGGAIALLLAKNAEKATPVTHRPRPKRAPKVCHARDAVRATNEPGRCFSRPNPTLQELDNFRTYVASTKTD